MKERVVVKYPPDYDGELHVHVETKGDKIGETATITLTIRKRSGESTIDVVRRAGSDMQRAR